VMSHNSIQCADERYSKYIADMQHESSCKYIRDLRRRVMYEQEEVAYRLVRNKNLSKSSC